MCINIFNIALDIGRKYSYLGYVTHSGSALATPFPLGEVTRRPRGYAGSPQNIELPNSAALILLCQPTLDSSPSLHPSAGGHTTP